MPRRIRIDKGFTEGLKSLPPRRQDAANKALVQFMDDPIANQLKFRTLKGKAGHHIINAKLGDRIILKHVEGDLYAAVGVGTHDIYRKWDRR